MKVDWLNGFYILVGVIGLLLAIIGLRMARRSNRRKLLTCDVNPPMSLASVLPDRTGHRLSIVYEGDGAEPVNVKAAYLHFVRIANLGKEPIRREDLAPSDPLRLEVEGVKVLDIADAGVSSGAINFALSPPEDHHGITASKISFDFLNFKDGAIIRILSDSHSANISLKGTIVGMEEGIRQISELRKSLGWRWLLLGVPHVAFIMIMTITTLYSMYEIDGGIIIGQKATPWRLLVIWIAGLVIMTGLLFWIVDYLLSPDRQWHAELRLPNWFISQSQHDRIFGR